MAVCGLLLVLLVGGCSSGSGSSTESGAPPTTEDPSYAASKRRNDLIAAFSRKYRSQDELNKRSAAANFDLSQEGLTVDIVRAYLFPETCQPGYDPATSPCEPRRGAAAEYQHSKSCGYYWAELRSRQSQLKPGEVLTFVETSGVISLDGTNCLPYKDLESAPEPPKPSPQGSTAESICQKFWADLAAKPSDYRKTFTEGTGYVGSTDCNPYKPK